MNDSEHGARSGKERILVVDDEQNARVALRTILAEEGYEVAEAADGEEALALLPGFAPAAVLADVRMPRMDGITLLKRAREQGSDAVFVMMTAFASVEAAVEAMRAGAENYLVKPLDVNAVLVVLEKALEKLPPAARHRATCASGSASATASTTSSATRPSCRRSTRW